MVAVANIRPVSAAQKMAFEEYRKFFQTVETTFVKPSKILDHPMSSPPSHLDHLHMDRYVSLIFAYKLADNTDLVYRQFVDRLKESLAKTLVPFYPVAGVVIKTSDPHHPRMFLHDDRGVPFTEAYKDDRMDNVVKQRDFVPVPELAGLEPAGLIARRPCQEFGESGNPCVVVQVTRFNCGGVVLGVAWDHLLSDMKGAMVLLKAWSDIASSGQTSIIPQHDRTALTPRHQQDASEVRNPPPMTAEEIAKLEKVMNTEFSMKVLHIRKEAIDAVKRAAIADGRNVSTMDCVSAHLWRCLARSYLESGTSDMTIFSTAVEGRGKMPGILTPHYFGNIIVPASVGDIAASDLLSKPLSHAASLIRNAITNVHPDTYWSIISTMDLANPWKTSINRTDYQLGLTSWIRFAMYDLDFGHGKPVFSYLNHIAQNSRKGQCIVLPSNLGVGNFDVLLYLAPKTIESLWADPEFTSVS